MNWAWERNRVDTDHSGRLLLHVFSEDISTEDFLLNDEAKRAPNQVKLVDRILVHCIACSTRNIRSEKSLS